MTKKCAHEIGPWPVGQQWPRCLKCEIELLRGNLSLAEEGLASAMQEIEYLKGLLTHHTVTPDPPAFEPGVYTCPCGLTVRACRESACGQRRLVAVPTTDTEPCIRCDGTGIVDGGECIECMYLRSEKSAEQVRCEFCGETKIHSQNCGYFGQPVRTSE